MNGRDPARNLVSFYPCIHCLFMSGYTSDIIAGYGRGVHFPKTVPDEKSGGQGAPGDR